MSSLYRRNGIYWLSVSKGESETGKSYSKPLRDPDHPHIKIRDKSTALWVKSRIDNRLIQGQSIVIPSQNAECKPALESYLRFHAQRRRPKVNAECKGRIERFLAWGHIVRISLITESSLQDHINQRMQGEWRIRKNGEKYLHRISAHESNQIIIAVKGWLNWCVRAKIIAENPVRELKKLKSPETTKRALDKGVVKIVLKAAGNPENYCDKKPVLLPLVATAIYAGLRKAELANLEWQDIDFKRDLLFVLNKEGFTTKSKKNRTIKLNPVLKEILLKYRKDRGKCFDVTNCRRIWRRIARDAGIPDLDLHELRHTFITQALLDGVPIPTVAAWAGHQSWHTTQNYTHLVPITKRTLQKPLLKE